MVLITEKRKDPGVPGSAPFKETVLKEAEERKRQVYILLDLQILKRVSSTQVTLLLKVNWQIII